MLFVDDFHGFNRAQRKRSCFVERGTITLVGATTENPSFEIAGRCSRGSGYSCWRRWAACGNRSCRPARRWWTARAGSGCSGLTLEPAALGT